MINPLRLRVSLAALITAAGIAFSIWIDDFSRQVDALRTARQAWQDNGLMLLAFFTVAVVAGTICQTWWASRSGRRLRAGWGNAGALIGYGIVVAALAWLVAPGGSGFSGGRGGGIVGAYLAWLVLVLLPPALVAAAGAQFEVDTPEGVAKGMRPMLVALIAGWCFGVIPFLFLVAAALIK